MTENQKENKNKMKMHSFIQQIFVKKLPLLGVFLGTGDKVLKKTESPHETCNKYLKKGLG